MTLTKTGKSEEIQPLLEKKNPPIYKGRFDCEFLRVIGKKKSKTKLN